MKKIIGYQIEDISGTHEIPDIFWSFEIFSEEDADKFLAEGDNLKYWKKVPVYKGDIQEYHLINIYE